MRLRRARVENFRSIVDSETVDITERVTVLVGKNEQGKTNFLKALGSFNSKYRYAPNDLPNHLRAALEERNPAEIPVVSLWLVPDRSEKLVLKQVIPNVDSIQEFRVTRYYDGQYASWGLTKDGAEAPVSFAVPNVSQLIDNMKKHAETLRLKLAAHANRLPAFAPGKTQADGHIDQFVSANFSDTAQIDNIIRTFSTALKAVTGQDQAVQDDIAAATKDIQGLYTEVQQLLQADPQLNFLATAPHFVFHSTLLDRIPNEVNVAEFIKDPEQTSKGMANFCRAAGLSTQKIQELASGMDTTRREAYEDHYRASISGGINEFWTQETYNIHFRIESERLSVSVSDSTYSRRIAPSERSDGFQWYLSFYSALINEVSSTDPTVILLDNPGLELHADGQRDIKRFLEEKLPSKTQVVYVTHSPAMINPFNLEQVRRVELRSDMQGTKVLRLGLKGDGEADLLEPVRSAIGASLVTSLMFNEYNILVEGAADKPILEGTFVGLQVGDFNKLILNGSISETGVFLPRFYQRAGLPFVICVDADSSGRELAESLKQASIPEEKIVYLAAAVPKHEKGQDFELEDIISDEFYHEAVCDTYPDQNVEPSGAGSGKKTKRYKNTFKEKYGFGFSKRRVGETVKKLLLEGKGDDSTKENLRSVAEKIWEALRRQVDSKNS